MSFYKAYGIREIYDENSEFQMDNYISIDEEYYKYNYELNKIYYCTNNIIVDNGNVIKYDPEKYIIMDYFIIDLVNKKIDVYDNKLRDSFSEVIGKIKNIEISRAKDYKYVYIINDDENIFELLLSLDNKLIGIRNNKINKLPDRFLISCQYLKYLDFCEVRTIGNDVLYANTDLEVLKLENAQIIGDYFLMNNMALREINLDKVVRVGDEFLKRNLLVNTLNMISLEEVGMSFMFSNKEMRTINMPNLVKAGKCFFKSDDKAIYVVLPCLIEAGEYFMAEAKRLRMFEADNLEKTGDMFLIGNKDLEYISLPNLKETGKMFLGANEIIMNVNLPRLNYLPKYFLRNALEIENINLANNCSWENIYNKKLLELLNKKKGKSL